MNIPDFKIIYRGSCVEDAEKHFNETENYSIVYCEQGMGVAYIEGARVKLDPLCALAFRSCGKSRGITVSDDFSGQFLLCDGTLAESLFRYHLKGRNFRLTSLGERTEKNLHFVESATNLGNEYLFHTLLCLISVEEQEPTEKTGVTSAAAIKEYIDSHTEIKITLDKLSKHFFISKTQIHRLFVAAYNVSPMRYMLMAKVKRSKELLLATDLRIADIAERLAFTDAKHYTKTFRNFTGMLPGEYRKKNQ